MGLGSALRRFLCGVAGLRSVRVSVPALACTVAVVALALPAAVEARTSITTMKNLQMGLLAEVNALRARHGLSQVQTAPGLRAAAREHSRAMGRRGFFSHDSPGGMTFSRRLERHYGTRADPYWVVGENLLWNVRRLSAAQIVRLWLGSPSHRRALLYPRWRHVGISAVRVTEAPGRVYRHRDVTIVTIDFGARRAAPG